ncbi:MAG TPA: hypothetical protein VH143_14040 [Kofleriaceae bacterium]|jgi:hypothetical protein|nr:hypothetical protein [Kofleriaceae bacterium]
MTARISILVLLAVGSSALASPHHARDRETARWLSIGGALGSVAIASVGAGMLAYGFSDGRGYDLRFEDTRRNGEIVIGVGAATTLLTPSLGEWYAGEAWSTGMKLRVAGIGVGLLATAVYFGTGSSSSCFQLEGGDYCSGGAPHAIVATAVIGGIAGALFVGGIVYDLFDAAKAADRHDARRLEVLPTVLRSASGSALPALGLAGRF